MVDRSVKIPVLLLIIAILLVTASFSSVFGQSAPLVKEWVTKDLNGTAAIVRLVPFENQNIKALKVRLRKSWHVEEMDLGFGARYLELQKGQGYSMGYVYALTYNGRVALYEAGIESYSDEWPRIERQIKNRWLAAGGPRFITNEHGFSFKRSIDPVLAEYRAAVASDLGTMKPVEVPVEIAKNYSSLIDLMSNATLSGTHRNDDIEALVAARRLDLLENVLRGHNPGARVLAALALLELEESENGLSSATKETITKVLNLNIKLNACVFDMCSYVTAKQALKWFDSGKAFPQPELPPRRSKP